MPLCEAYFVDAREVKGEKRLAKKRQDQPLVRVPIKAVCAITAAVARRSSPYSSAWAEQGNRSASATGKIDAGCIDFISSLAGSFDRKSMTARMTN
jgi:hypothetical protein